LALAAAVAVGCGNSHALVDTLGSEARSGPIPVRPSPSLPSDEAPPVADGEASPGAPAGDAWTPGTTITRSVLRDDAFLQMTNIPPAWFVDIGAQYTASLYVPRGLMLGDGLSFLLVFGAVGANTESLPAYGPVADTCNLLVMAVDGDQPSDNTDGRNFEAYYCALKLRSELEADGTLGPASAFLVAGFSGGGKDAMAVGECGGTATFRGAISAGVNEDFATYEIGLIDNPTSRALPFVIVNATDDSVVNTYTTGVLTSMQQSGFTDVSLISYTGGHVFPPLATMQQAVDSILGEQ
jgi:hypothetical protein